MSYLKLFPAVFSLFIFVMNPAMSQEKVEQVGQSCCPGPCCPGPALIPELGHNNKTAEEALAYLRAYKAKVKEQEALSTSHL